MIHKPVSFTHLQRWWKADSIVYFAISYGEPGDPQGNWEPYRELIAKTLGIVYNNVEVDFPYRWIYE
jgi:hypothetical protein